MQIRIKGLCKKMREKIKQHGDWWNLVTKEGAAVYIVDGVALHIETTIPVHSGKYPYAGWFTVGKDFQILETKE